MLAREYLKSGQQKKGNGWALRAERAWVEFEKVEPRYYNSHVWKAWSQGLQGRVDDMEKSLRRAAKLSGQPRNYREFEDVRADVKRFQKLLGRNLKPQPKR
jgi:hypothetical protein